LSLLPARRPPTERRYSTCAVNRVSSSSSSSSIPTEIRGRLRSANRKVLALLLFCLSPLLAIADTSLSDCTDPAALETALNAGGVVTFSCDGSNVLTHAITISNTVVLDGANHTVTISANNSFRLFTVASGGNFTIRNLTLANGLSTNGGCIFVATNATLAASNCTFIGNSAIGKSGVNGANGGDSFSVGSDGGAGTAGASGWGGAIYNLGTNAIVNCSLLANRAQGGAGGNGGTGGNGGFRGGKGGGGGSGGSGFGGAIYNLGWLEVTNSTIGNNSATGASAGTNGVGGAGPEPGFNSAGGPGGQGSGGGLYNLRFAIIVSSTFSSNAGISGNSAAGGTTDSGAGSTGQKGGDSLGGGAFNSGTNIFLNCTFAANNVTAGNGGNGGDANDSIAGNGGNGGTGAGGAIYNVGSMAVTNCTVAGNGAVGGLAGSAGMGTFAGANGGAGASRGANIANGAGPFLLKTTILANPSSGTNTTTTTNVVSTTNVITTNFVACVTNLVGGIPVITCQTNPISTTNITITTNVVTTTTPGAAANSYGPVTDTGFNLSTDASLGTPGPGTIRTTNAFLAALSDNGGPTKTFALLSLSPARDKGDTNFYNLPTNSWAWVDQRGARRPALANFDIGAYEYGVAPSVTVTPAALPVTNGTSATFTASVIGDQPVSYQWRNNSSIIPAATNSSYTVSFATSSGSYDVIVTNLFGSSTSSPPAILTVKNPPVILTQPTNLTVTLGGAATFTVVATGDAPLAYFWQFNGATIGNAPNAGSYTINTATTNDAGSYQVIVSNNVGSVASSTVVLTVLVPPAITTGPQSQTVPLGTNVTFQVTATGSEPLSYQWRLNGANISEGIGSSYSISGVTAGQAGNYDVVVSNAAGSVTSAPPAVLTVLLPPSPPAIQTQPMSQAVAFGATATLSVAATGGQLAYQWYYNGATSLPNATNSSLIISNASSLNAGTYRVVITNSYGAITSQVAALTVGLFRLGGQVTKNGSGLAGVTITVTPGGASSISDFTGHYIVGNLTNGTYLVTPSIQDSVVFNPPSLRVVVTADVNTANFTAIPTFIIGGVVTNSSGAGLEYVTVTALSQLPAVSTNNPIVITNASVTDFFGRYAISAVPAVETSVTPFLCGYAFNPGAITNVVTTNEIMNFGGFDGPACFMIMRNGQGGVLLLGQGIPERNYEIQAADGANGVSTNGAAWFSILTTNADHLGGFRFSETVNTNLPSRFYRVRTP